MQIVINCGGAGTRLWPLSTQETPKQFVALIDDESFLQKTVNRLLKHFDKDQLWINTQESYKKHVLKHVGEFVREDHILTEPMKRDNYPAIVSHAALIAGKVGGDEPLIFVHADHWVNSGDISIWNNGIQNLGDSCSRGEFSLITAAVYPLHANTQLGYIEIDQSDKGISNHVVPVKQFKEKPDLATAQSFIDSGNFVWNLGYFGFTYNSIIKFIRSKYPDHADIFDSFKEAGDIDAGQYEQLPAIAFDNAVAEVIDSLGVIVMPIDWEDIGNWAVVKKHLPPSEEKNHIQVSSSDNIIKSVNTQKQIALIGVHDLIVVDTEDALLIVHPDHVAEVKQVAKYFQGQKPKS